jgi:hypothetical protein
MTPEETQFRDRLVAAQAQDATLKGKYEREIHAMLEQKLNRPVKWLLIALIALCVLAAVLTAANLPRLWSQTPLAREMAICGLVFELAVAASLGWMVARGSLRTAAHGFVLAGLCGVFSLWAAGLLHDVIAGLAPDQRARNAPLPFVVLALGWLPMVLVTISYYHNRTREKLLEIQYQLAELAEEVKRHR